MPNDKLEMGESEILTREKWNGLVKIVEKRDQEIREVLTVTNDKKVGIGMSSPEAPLHIGSGTIINQVTIGHATEEFKYAWPYESIGVTKSNYNLRLQSPNGIYFHTAIGNNEEESKKKIRLAIARNGSIGVGTFDPKNTLHAAGNAGVINIEGRDHAYFQFYPQGYNSGRKAWLGYGGANTKKLTIMNQNDDVLALGTNGKEVLLIDKYENLRIGNKAGGGNKLMLTNSLEHHFIRATGWWTEFVSHKNEGWRFKSSENNADTKLVIQAGSGNVGIGTTTPSTKLHVIGEVFSVHLKASSDLNIGRNANINGTTRSKVFEGREPRHKGAIIRGRGGHRLSFAWVEHRNKYWIRIYVDDIFVKAIEAWGEIREGHDKGNTTGGKTDTI